MKNLTNIAMQILVDIGMWDCDRHIDSQDVRWTPSQIDIYVPSSDRSTQAR